MNLFKIFDFFKKAAYKNYSVSSETEEKIRSEWSKINELIKLGSPSNLRQALISADKTLDNALRDVMEGTSMGERLKNARNRFDPITYQRVWEAHKVRNNLVHESGYEPAHYVLLESIRDLKAGVTQLGVKL